MTLAIVRPEAAAVVIDLAVADVVFREDLYPRINTSAETISTPCATASR